MWRFVITSCLICAFLANKLYALEPELWAEDIQQYENGLRDLHIDPFSVISEEEFTTSLGELKSSLAEMSDSEVILELMALTHRIGDGHTAIRIGSYDRFPLELYYIDGSWKVIGVHQNHSEMLGLSIVSIDGRLVDEVADALKPYLQHVENIQSEEIRLNEALVNATLLFALGLTGEENTATFVFANQNGEYEVTLDAARNIDGGEIVRYETSQPVVNRVSGPEWGAIWYGTLEDTDAVYVSFSGYPAFEEMMVFGEGLLNYINTNASSKLVVDLRRNGGGDFFVGLVLASYLNLADSIDWQSGVYLLTDKYTFSAAVSNAAQFRQILNATIIGEPTGGNPVGYQDMGTFRLKNSGLVVTYSKRLFRFQDEATEGVQPDIPVEYEWDAFVSGTDNILQFVVDRIKDGD